MLPSPLSFRNDGYPDFWNVFCCCSVGVVVVRRGVLVESGVVISPLNPSPPQGADGPGHRRAGRCTAAPPLKIITRELHPVVRKIKPTANKMLGSVVSFPPSSLIFPIFYRYPHLPPPPFVGGLVAPRDRQEAAGALRRGAQEVPRPGSLLRIRAPSPWRWFNPVTVSFYRPKFLELRFRWLRGGIQIL